MRVSSAVIFETESVSDDQTKVNLTNTGALKYPLNIMTNGGKEISEGYGRKFVSFEKNYRKMKKEG